MRSSAAVAAPATPKELVNTYDNLATAILAVKKAEEGLVKSVLATAYGHAEAAQERAQGAIAAGDTATAKDRIEEVAAYVAQIAAEGDNSVAGIRKRLLEGGHHHHADDDEEDGAYEPGYVVVTKTAKKELLEISRAIAQQASKPDPKALTAEWEKVTKVWAKLMN